MVQTRSKSGGRKRSKVKLNGGCRSCCEEKTKCSDIFNQNGKTEIHSFVNLRDSNTRVSKKPSGKRSPPILTSGLLERRNIVTLERNGRSNEDCVKAVDDWLKTFQQNVQIEPQHQSAMEEEPTEEPSTSTSPVSPQQHVEQVVCRVDSTTGPPSVSSSVSAASPASSGGETFVLGGSGGASCSSGSQDEQQDCAGPARPVRTKERREKQRLASAKSRRKKKSEGDELKLKAQDLVQENERLQGVIQGLEAQRERYLSGDYEFDDSDIIDPEDEPDAAAGSSAS